MQPLDYSSSNARYWSYTLLLFPYWTYLLLASPIMLTPTFTKAPLLWRGTDISNPGTSLHRRKVKAMDATYCWLCHPNIKVDTIVGTAQWFLLSLAVDFSLLCSSFVAQLFLTSTFSPCASWALGELDQKCFHFTIPSRRLMSGLQAQLLVESFVWRGLAMYVYFVAVRNIADGT